jgi:hypothetical protein
MSGAGQLLTNRRANPDRPQAPKEATGRRPGAPPAGRRPGAPPAGRRRTPPAAMLPDVPATGAARRHKGVLARALGTALYSSVRPWNARAASGRTPEKESLPGEVRRSLKTQQHAQLDRIPRSRSVSRFDAVAPGPVRGTCDDGSRAEIDPVWHPGRPPVYAGSLVWVPRIHARQGWVH